MLVWNEEFEKMNRNELEQVQLERLQETLTRVYRRVAYYHNLFNEIGFDPLEISKKSDLQKIPFTTKDTLRDAYPYDMFAVPLREVVRMQSTAGTTGEALIVGYTKNDIDHWTELTARVLTAGEVVKDDIVQITFPYGLSTGGLGFHYGAEMIGASVIPSSEADIGKQATIMRDYRTTVIISAPTFAAQLAETLDEKGITPAELSLSKGLFGAEPWSDAFRKEIEQKLSISATDNYGLTEIIGPGVSYECNEKNGLHVSEDHFIPEIIDPDTGKTLPSGKKGELVISTITKEAFPLIRYRTGDITYLIEGDCPCGRTFVRMARVSERYDDMIILNGQNMFPSQFEQILTEVIGLTPTYQLVIDKADNLDELIIQVEVSSDFFSDEIKKLNQLEFHIIRDVKERLDFVPKVKFVEPGTIERKMKKKKVIDRRNK
ncbi:MAG: phenylacetate--CoA ligase [Spirochaetota bacterium]|nr:MAG: phenylacetate--CoA ligase [Spirochaetota bacterium]